MSAPSSHRPDRPAARFLWAAAATGGMVIVGVAAPASADVEDLTDLVDGPTPHTLSLDSAIAMSAGSPTGQWFVELSRPAPAVGGSVAAVDSQQSDFMADAAAEGISIDVTHEYSTVWNGLAIVVDDSDIDPILELDGVVGAWPVLLVDAPETVPNALPDLHSAVTMTGADTVVSELGFDGTGIHVAVMDTGIDYDHPDLGGSGVDGGDTFPTARVTTGYDLVGDTFNADPSDPAYQPVPHPDDDPDDCQGHGTHVAGIVGASGDTAAGGVQGVAPGVTLGAYRVFGCEGSTTTAVMNAAMEMAFRDGADVLNMSIGSAFAGWSDYPTSVLASRLHDLGMVVTASIGNSGASGTWAAGAPGNGRSVIGVANFDNVMMTTPALAAGPDGELMAYIHATGSPVPETGARYTTISAAGAPGTDEGRGCSPLTGDHAGNLVLIERGICTFSDKAANAQAAGAAALIMYNNLPGLLNPTVVGDTEITIPVVFVDQAAGLELVDRIGTEGFDVTFTGATVSAVNPTGGLINPSSSYGATAELDLKPNLGAPGGSIYSTYPLELGGYASATGTSMSAPHVAGAVALYLEAHPDAAPGTIRDVLQNYAIPAVWSLNTPVGLAEPVHRQGAGLIQIDSSILAGVVASPGQLVLGESEGGPRAQTVTLTSTSDEAVTYALSIEDAVSTGGNPDNPAFFWAPSTYAGPSSVTVPAGGTVSFDVSISPNPGLDLVQYGGYLDLVPTGDSDATAISIPYYGFAGDYQSLRLFRDAAGESMPTLATLVDCERLVGDDCLAGAGYDIVDSGTTFSMELFDRPSVLWSLENAAQEITLRVLSASLNGGGVAFTTATVGRTPGFNGFTWDGTVLTEDRTERVALPDGNYVFELTAVSALGTEAAGELERWTSGTFTIDRDGDDVPPRPPSGPVATFLTANSWADGRADFTYEFGRPTDEVLVGDWDGDGVDTISVRRGNRYLINNDRTGNAAVDEIHFGRAADDVLVGDWDGDGVDTLTVRRGATYFISNSMRTGWADREVTYGRPGDTVLVGDFDGDRTDSITVRRGNTYFVAHTLRDGPADHVFTYGRADDVVLVGDWDGDDLDTLLVRRGNQYLLRNTLTDGWAEQVISYGRAGDIVHVGDWDGDGTDTPAVQR